VNYERGSVTSNGGKNRQNAIALDAYNIYI
jgi:hypothetical protein